MVTKKVNPEDSPTMTFEQKIERFERVVDVKSDGFKVALTSWLRTSQFFDGMVNTPARMIINFSSIGVLYFWGFWVFASETGMVAWGVTLAILLGMQAASVRFAFSIESAADEHQIKRISQAYKRAYRAIRHSILVSALIMILFVFLGERRGESWYNYYFSKTGTFYMDNYRAMFIAIFVVALVSFQKYFSYGMKGEPFTIREKNRIKD